MSSGSIEAIGNLIISLFTLIILFYKQVRVNGGLKSLNTEVKYLSSIIKNMWQKETMKSELSDVIQTRAYEGIKNNSFLDKAHKDIIMNWADKIEIFSHDAYYTKYRKKPGIEDYLTTKSGAIVSDLEKYTIQMLPGKVNINKKPCNIVDFIKSKSKVYQEIDSLVYKLVKNGLDDIEYITLFEDFTYTVVGESIKAFIKWNPNPKQNGNN